MAAAVGTTQLPIAATVSISAAPFVTGAKQVSGVRACDRRVVVLCVGELA